MAALQDVGSLATVTGEQCPVSSELPHTQLQLASDPFWDPGRGQRCGGNGDFRRVGSGAEGREKARAGGRSPAVSACRAR